MIRKLRKNIAVIVTTLILTTLLVSCGEDTTPLPATAIPSNTAAPTPTYTPLPPTPTAVPLAVTVNGEAVTLAEYQSELERARQGMDPGTILATDSGTLESWVLDQLIDQVLLAQEARSSGFNLDDDQLQERIDVLVVQAGGQESLEAWMANNGFTLEGFRDAIRRAAEAAWMRDQIASSVPDTAEQVHARQILLYNQTDADQVLAQLQNGADFESLAFTYDPVSGGDLGWFPLGYLTQPSVEEAVFLLQPGEYTSVIQSEIGFHIVQVIERDPQHPLDPAARLILQNRTVETWLDQSRDQSDIQIFVPDI